VRGARRSRRACHRGYTLTNGLGGTPARIGATAIISPGDGAGRVLAQPHPTLQTPAVSGRRTPSGSPSTKPARGRGSAFRHDERALIAAAALAGAPSAPRRGGARRSGAGMLGHDVADPVAYVDALGAFTLAGRAEPIACARWVCRGRERRRQRERARARRRAQLPRPRTSSSPPRSAPAITASRAPERSTMPARSAGSTSCCTRRWCGHTPDARSLSAGSRGELADREGAADAVRGARDGVDVLAVIVERSREAPGQRAEAVVGPGGRCGGAPALIYEEASGCTAIASIETSRPWGKRTWAGAERAGGGSGMCRA
jgi:hypothetical protein